MANPSEASSTIKRPALKKQRIDLLLHPFMKFQSIEASGGIVLLLATFLALLWANSKFHESYVHLWEQTLFTIGIGPFALSKSLHHWINDGLMAIFFFVVGLEIKREFLIGELSTAKQAALPIAAAIGGMVVPALFFVMFNKGGVGEGGWGIPMATDIAFAIGVVTLMGKKVPISLKVFLTALAIVDDLGAVLVIAVFYSGELAWNALLIGLGFLGVSMWMSWSGVRRVSPYVIVGIVVWIAFLKSGVHATIAGVLLAMTIPARTRFQATDFVNHSEEILKSLKGARKVHGDALSNPYQEAALQALEVVAESSASPMQTLERKLHPFVMYGIMPIFALANAGVHIEAGSTAAAFSHPVTLGIIFGLVFGKLFGISAFSWLAIRLKLAELPRGTNWLKIFGVSALGGIGFTMSIFIANLAFDPQSQAELIVFGKIGILTASIAAGVIGWVLLQMGAAKTAKK